VPRVYTEIYYFVVSIPTNVGEEEEGRGGEREKGKGGICCFFRAEFVVSSRAVCYWLPRGLREEGKEER